MRSARLKVLGGNLAWQSIEKSFVWGLKKCIFLLVIISFFKIIKKFLGIVVI